MGEKVKAAIQRWRQRRQHRKQQRRQNPGQNLGRVTEASRRDARLRREDHTRGGGWNPGI